MPSGPIVVPGGTAARSEGSRIRVEPGTYRVRVYCVGVGTTSTTEAERQSYSASALRDERRHREHIVENFVRAASISLSTPSIFFIPDKYSADGRGHPF